MARESRRRWASVIEAPVAVLDADGFHLDHTGPLDACPGCGCPMGGHLAVLPGDTTTDTVLERIGWVECERCDVSCGTWSITPGLW